MSNFFLRKSAPWCPGVQVNDCSCQWFLMSAESSIIVRCTAGDIEKLLWSCKYTVLLLTEKELNELLKEVFDGYESDTSDTLTGAVTGSECDNVLPPLADNVDAQNSTSSRHPTPRKLRSADRQKDDVDDYGDIAKAGCLSQQDAENETFRYPGHIPPLKYIPILLMLFTYWLCKLFGFILELLTCNLCVVLSKSRFIRLSKCRGHPVYQAWWMRIARVYLS